MIIKHAFTADLDKATGDDTLVQPGDWNANHVLDGLLYAIGNVTGPRVINWNDGITQSLTLTGNTSVTFSNPVIGSRYRLLIKQDATGSRSFTLPASVKFYTGSKSAINSAANSVTEIFLNYDGTDYHGFIPGAGTPGGSTGHLQYNMAGALGGTSRAVYDSGGDTLTLNAPLIDTSFKMVTSGTDRVVFTNPSQNVVQIQGLGDSKTTSLHLNPGSGTLPNDTVCEFVVGRTPGQAFGGNYGRWSFTCLGSGNGNVSGIYGEYGGTTPQAPFIFHYGYEVTEDDFLNYEIWRAITDSTATAEAAQAGSMLFGATDGTSRNKIVLSMPNIGGTGQRDSHAILWEGKANDGTERAVWWRAFADVTGNAGASAFKIQENLNGGGWTSRFILPSTAVANFGDSDSYVPTWGGFSSAPTGGAAQYIQMGKLVFVRVTGWAAGTSNSTSLTITLPVTAGLASVNAALVMDNSVFQSAPGRADIAAASNTLTIYKDFAGGAFTNSGSKVADFAIVYVAQ